MELLRTVSVVPRMLASTACARRKVSCKAATVSEASSAQAKPFRKEFIFSPAGYQPQSKTPSIWRFGGTERTNDVHKTSARHLALTAVSSVSRRLRGGIDSNGTLVDEDLLCARLRYRDGTGARDVPRFRISRAALEE